MKPATHMGCTPIAWALAIGVLMWLFILGALVPWIVGLLT